MTMAVLGACKFFLDCPLFLLNKIFEDRKSVKWALGADDRRRGEVEGETDYSPPRFQNDNYWVTFLVIDKCYKRVIKY